MSATNRGAVRRDLDHYATPAWVTRAILPHLRPTPNAVRGRIDVTACDPCCGEGAILDVLRTDWPAVCRIGLEIDPGRRALASAQHTIVGADALTSTPWAENIELVITNPPYSRAMEFAQRALVEVREGGTVAMLLRLGWLASQKRALWLRENTPSIYVLPKRPSFTGSGNDSTDYAWFVWERSDRYGRAVPMVRILEVPS